jgi:hypothetical protein
VKRLASIILAGTVTAAAPVSAQQAASRAAIEQRYQIGQMERVLEGAVEHGLSVTRDRVQALAQMPPDMLVSDNAHARGFRLDGYGVFFDVAVPSFETTWTWSLRTLDQNDLGIESAMRTLQTHVKTEGDPDLEQALKRLELQLGPAIVARTWVPAAPGARNVTGSAAAAADDRPPAATDPILADPNEAYRTEVLQALKDAMLSHSSSLGIAPNEWLTIAAKGNDDRPRLAPADSSSSTRLIRLRGSDLGEFLAGRITRDEALQRIEVRVF